MADVDRDIGRIEGTLQSHAEKLESIEADVKLVLEWINKQRGGKAAMTGMLMTAAAIGGAVAEGIHALARLGVRK